MMKKLAKLSLKAYKAKDESERLAAYTEIYKHYGIEMLPEEKEIFMKATPFQSQENISIEEK